LPDRLPSLIDILWWVRAGLNKRPPSTTPVAIIFSSAWAGEDSAVGFTYKELITPVVLKVVHDMYFSSYSFKLEWTSPKYLYFGYIFSSDQSEDGVCCAMLPTWTRTTVTGMMRRRTMVMLRRLHFFFFVCPFRRPLPPMLLGLSATVCRMITDEWPCPRQRIVWATPPAS
jgi:hypothetical protein